MTPEERDARTVFCMQLSARIRPRDLEEFFSSVGKVSACVHMYFGIGESVGKWQSQQFLNKCMGGVPEDFFHLDPCIF